MAGLHSNTGPQGRSETAGPVRASGGLGGQCVQGLTRFAGRAIPVVVVGWPGAAESAGDRGRDAKILRGSGLEVRGFELFAQPGVRRALRAQHRIVDSASGDEGHSHCSASSRTPGRPWKTAGV